ncbi:MAG: CBS domain-containing protein [Planctomycetota bacterium]|jgi:CBS domain-containing protein
MTVTKASHDHMRRLFTESFSVSDVAEPLVSFDADAPAADVRRLMAQNAYQVVGVRREGVMAGYVTREELDGGLCGDSLRVFDDAEVVFDSACLPTAVALLSERPRLFVITFGRVGGIVTRSDLQKPPVRMWLFGMVTIVEMGLLRLIEERFPSGGWEEHLSAGRLEKAQALLVERKRRNQELDLLDCLQFSDKGLITLKDELLRARVGYQSRRRGEETIKRLEALRNNLAHSQDIISSDWETIVGLSENLDAILAI